MKHNPILGASWMLLAGLAFAIVNSIAQYLAINFHLPSTTVAFFQYGIALVVLMPWLLKLGLRKSLGTKHFYKHCFRVSLAVIGIQCWLWALAYPIPIWQGIALLMLSPIFATIGASLFLGERVGWSRYGVTIIGFIGALIVLAPWSESFSIAALLPVAAAFFWALYSLMVKRLSSEDSPTTMVIYLLILMTPFNLFLAITDWQVPVGEVQWGWLVLAGLLTAVAQWAIASAYSVADASFVQPFDHAKLPFNVFLGWLVFGWVPPGELWLGAALIVGSVAYITHREVK